ncbi:apoptosis facilitator Bcl-2-like protein 14 [Dipodomys spectabilis]|uniref:apoptosis facilitator Bcl-2-like protein 14 n=1 Tax=Dipodomys spectabilis TaxID=105255 RepID=UPI001C535EA8|nr:apoptosis facilitator Bcl-2-like protein 14 [Dipodomys spectabilis]
MYSSSSSSSTCELEDVPLSDDDPDSMEFKILAFYARHHAFKGSPIFPAKLQRTRTEPQKGPGPWAADAWTQHGPGSWRHTAMLGEKSLGFGKRPSWRRLFGGGAGREEDSPSSPPGEVRTHCQVSSLSLPSVEQRLQSEAMDPKVASIANRVAEIVYSWPPPEDRLHQGGHKLKEYVVPYTVYQGFGGAEGATGAEKDGEDPVIGRIVALLKASGDQLERELKKDKALLSSLRETLSYPAFKTITDQFLRDVDTRGESEVKAQGFKAALAIDAMAKLTAIDTHPMNRVLGFGAKYLKDHFSPWVQQHGGWEKILGISHDKVD